MTWNLAAEIATLAITLAALIIIVRTHPIPRR
jgi:hypothetical protein